MSLKEAQEAKPFRLRIVTVKAGDTIETLSRRMATDHKRERFLVINGLTASEHLRPGEQVKIAVE